MDDFNRRDRSSSADVAKPDAAADQRLREDRPQERTIIRQSGPASERSSDGQVTDGDHLSAGHASAEAGRSGQQPSGSSAQSQKHMALFPDNELQNYRTRWNEVQTSFVDEPRRAVEDADSLVANVVKRLAEQFAAERADLEKQWDKGGDVSTEDLRQSLRRYRAFFDRLLSV